MTCGVCGLDGDAKGCSPNCVALLVLAGVAGMSADERADLAWDFRRQRAVMRGEEFNEPPPKCSGERDSERFELMMRETA